MAPDTVAEGREFPDSKLASVLLSGAPLGGGTGSWRPGRPQTGVPEGLVWADPPGGAVLPEETRLSQNRENDWRQGR